MPFQKLKLLYLMDIFRDHTDENHPISMPQIQRELEARSVSAERKSIYKDIDVLRSYGMDVVQVGVGAKSGYYLGSRLFELPELQLLVDSVQASRCLTPKKTAQLIHKLESLCSDYDAKILHRQVFSTGTLKPDNESIFYNIDVIQKAIARNRKIRFHYFRMTVDKERKQRKGGAWYVHSPFALVQNNDYYYLVAFDDLANRIKHFRVDRMMDVAVSPEPREGHDVFETLDMARYTGKVFGMFGGRPVNVTMRFSPHLAGAVIDRFGHDVWMVADENGNCEVRAEVVPSPQFYSWILGFGVEARILAPDRIVKEIKEYLKDVYDIYR